MLYVILWYEGLTGRCFPYIWMKISRRLGSIENEIINVFALKSLNKLTQSEPNQVRLTASSQGSLHPGSKP